MPKGFSAIKKAAEKAGKGSGYKSNVLFIKLANGESANVRFLEQGEDVYFYYYHDFSNLSKSQGWKTKVPCLDQEDDGTPCPGCEQQLPRKFQGLINVIWRDAPLYARDKDGNIEWDKQEGTADQIAVFRQGKTVFEKVLPRKDAKYKGLGSRDFEIYRDGGGLEDTTYSVEPVDPDGGAQPLSKEDKKIAEGKHDLEEVARFVDKDRFEEIIEKKVAEYSGDEDDDDTDDIKDFLKKKPHDD